MLTFLYMLLSAAFFVACAYAQLNDPDPEIWVATYVFCGAVLNMLALLGISSLKTAMLLAHHKKTDGDKRTGAAAAAASTGSSLYSIVVSLTWASAIFLGVFLAYEWAVIAQRYGVVLPAVVDLKHVWSFLEMEEGREVVGLLLLLVHVLVLSVFLGNATSKVLKRVMTNLMSSHFGFPLFFLLLSLLFFLLFSFSLFASFFLFFYFNSHSFSPLFPASLFLCKSFTIVLF
jgi:TRAP-type C4-dicarboxylate transport system permease large subunit